MEYSRLTKLGSYATKRELKGWVQWNESNSFSELCRPPKKNRTVKNLWDEIQKTLIWLISYVKGGRWRRLLDWIEIKEGIYQAFASLKKREEMAGVFKFLSPRAPPQPIDIQAAALWGVAAVTTALWIVQVPLFFLVKINIFYLLLFWWFRMIFLISLICWSECLK